MYCFSSKFTYFTVLLLVLIISFPLKSDRKYYNINNDFGELLNNGSSVIKGNILYAVGSEANPAFLLAKLPENSGSPMSIAFNYANEKDCDDIPFGIIVNYVDSANYTELYFKSGNTDKYEINDTRYMDVELGNVVQGKSNNSICSGRIVRQHGRDGNYNSIRLIFSNERLLVQYKKSVFSTVMEVPFSIINGSQFGFKVYGNLMLKNMYIDYAVNMKDILTLNSRKEAIDSIISFSKDPLVGYWKYFDRKIDTDKVKLGGKYNLAIVPSETAGYYYILYVSAAQVNKDKWESYMVKGILSPSGVPGNYNLLWYDSNMQPMEDDCYVSFVSNVLIDVVFPIEKSSFRMIKN